MTCGPKLRPVYGSASGTTLRGSSDVRIGVASFLRHTTQEREWIECVQADPLVEIADSILEYGDPRFLSHGDGIVTFRCENGDVTYGLVEHDDLRMTWLGVRSGFNVDDDDDAA